MAPATLTPPGGEATDLALWLKAEIGLTSVSAGFSRWDDQSQNNYDFANVPVTRTVSASNAPAATAELINFYPGLQFNDDQLANSQISLDPGSNRTYYIVYDPKRYTGASF